MQVIVGVLLFSSCLALPKPQDEEMKPEEGAEQVGAILKKLPSILSKTASWLNDLGKIGDDIHPAVGDTIRTGASQVSEASNNVPDDLNLTIQQHINKLIDLTKSLQGDIKDGLGNLPELQEQVDGIPGEEYIDEIISGVPSAAEVDSRINEAINFIQPIADALGSNSTQPKE